MSTICGDNSNCPLNNPICDRLSSTCIQCKQTSDCNLGSYCDNINAIGQCVAIPVCSVDINCGNYSPYIKCNNSIDQVNGTCVECLNSNQCMSNQNCEEFRCIAISNQINKSKTGLIIGIIAGIIIITAIIITLILIFRKKN